ncbi:IucA/IucC family siderophore biosynthesis protein [Cyanobacteria bacterium FACHB-472]|nr:IucA/IucC family siderophore biosynthesis protein [Cyanobacteria bacterium FACHB-472]
MNHREILNRALQPQRWQLVCKTLLAKMISEFMYEEIITPEIVEKHENHALYQLSLPQGIIYRFEAKHRLFNSYRAIPDSMQRRDSDWLPATNPFQFILDISETIGMSATTTAHFLKEISNTLLADAHIHADKERRKTNLLNLDYAHLEGEMEGHPWITFNKGRIGFNYNDYLAYAPERKQEVSFLWIAVSQDRAKFNAVSSLDYSTLIKQELGDKTLAEFQSLLTLQGVNPEKYYFIPVHEWQWKNNLVSMFSEDIAIGAIIPLDISQDRYLPQQSIRTFLNISHSQKRNVKLPISILNTSVYRGLPGAVLAPYMTEWLKEICDKDAFLRDECRLILIGEVAGVQYFHPYYMNLVGAPYQYREMLACIWRESVFSFTEPEEKPITLASLVHIDNNDKLFISQLVAQSGLSLETWLERLFSVILPPLLHYLYRYGTVFSPHGENVILVLKDNVPHRLAIKDFLDDVNISNHPLPELESFPAAIKQFFPGEPSEKLCQYIWAGLFICHFRYLSDLLETHHHYPESSFWKQVRQAILNYQSRFPEMRSRFDMFDLLTPSFTKLCLNRNRLLTQGYADESTNRPATAAFGKVSNALHEVADIPIS